jgi:tRNA modification GTPase
VDQDGEAIDEILFVSMRAPNSYTSEDVVELNCHGNPLILKKVLGLVIKEGARLAEPGEFTKRAFLNGKIDLVQAEAVIDLIRAKTDEALRCARNQLFGKLSNRIKEIKEAIISMLACIEAEIEFPEDDIEDIINPHRRLEVLKSIVSQIRDLIDSYNEGKVYRDGIRVVIIGRPNVGKSSLFNSLLMENRVIVSSFSGTTRDTVEDFINIKGIPLRIADTAGLGEAKNFIEEEGIRVAKERLDLSDIAILVIDGSFGLTDEDLNILELKELKRKDILIAINKIDIAEEKRIVDIESRLEKYRILKISALKGYGIDRLKDNIYSIISSGIKRSPSDSIISNLRHSIALENALNSLLKAYDGIQNGIYPELIALEFKMALNFIGEILGEATSDDILNRIFSEFCIGK